VDTSNGASSQDLRISIEHRDALRGLNGLLPRMHLGQAWDSQANLATHRGPVLRRFPVVMRMYEPAIPRLLDPDHETNDVSCHLRDKECNV